MALRPGAIAVIVIAALVVLIAIVVVLARRHREWLSSWTASVRTRAGAKIAARELRTINQQGAAVQKLRRVAREAAKRVNMKSSHRWAMHGETSILVPSNNKRQIAYAALSSRLGGYGLAIDVKQVEGDCQFHALLDQMRHSEDVHLRGVRDVQGLRALVVDWLGRSGTRTPNNPSPSIRAGFRDDAGWDAYIGEMAKGGTWGDERCLIAISTIFNVVVFVISSGGSAHDRLYHPPGGPNDVACLYLGHIMESPFFVSTRLLTNSPGGAGR